MGKDRVCYFYDSELEEVYYGANHPMKPPRLCMAHHLVLGYELHKHLEVYVPRRAVAAELKGFHTEDYINFLSHVTVENQESLKQQLLHFNMTEDCPVFEGLWEFCRLYAGASIQAATRLNHGLSDIAINWSGGLHHAKKAEASGFCYVNDLVLAILELLKYHTRVLYIDIDIHHGDGVEEAFYLTDRVMTVSFHKFGEYFFPGTGDLVDVGEKAGRYYSVNVPMRRGATDVTFHALFKPIMERIMEVFRPGCVVLQCGADSLSGDRLGCFNLSLAGHAEAVRYMKSFGIPLLVTGGGGYTKQSVAKCWALETAVLVGQDKQLADELPDNAYHDYFTPDFRLNASRKRIMEDENSKAEVERIKIEVLENLRHLELAPGVQMHQVPPDMYMRDYDAFAQEDGADARLLSYAQAHSILRDPEWGDEDHNPYA